MLPPSTPTSSNRRLDSLDVLRGFAIFGILMVNMPWMNSPIALSISTITLWDSAPDKIAEFITRFLFESKFYVIFSFLFGYGFYLFMQQLRENSCATLRIHYRRMVILMFFGAAHVILLWPGDILLFYGILGLLLPLFRDLTSRALVTWAILLILVPVVLMGLSVALVNLSMMFPESRVIIEESIKEHNAKTAALINNALGIYSTGSFTEIVNMRLIEYRSLLPYVIFFYPNVLAMFLVGLLAARRGYLEHPSRHLNFFKQAVVLAIIVGLPFNFLYSWIVTTMEVSETSFWPVLGMACAGFAGPVLALGYASAIILLTSKGKGEKISYFLKPVGRMALTNYLMHSIISSMLFHAHGLGLYGSVSTWQSVVISMIIFALQIPFSIYWLSHFNFGPMEWLWRSLTYRGWQPFIKHHPIKR